MFLICSNLELLRSLNESDLLLESVLHQTVSYIGNPCPMDSVQQCSLSLIPPIITLYQLEIKLLLKNFYRILNLCNSRTVRSLLYKRELIRTDIFLEYSFGLSTNKKCMLKTLCSTLNLLFKFLKIQFSFN